MRTPGQNIRRNLALKLTRETETLSEGNARREKNRDAMRRLRVKWYIEDPERDR